MLRAIAVKFAFGVVMAVQLGVLGWPAAFPWMAATFALAAGFFAWAIAVPSAQFLVPSVNRLPGRLPEAGRAVAFTFDDGPDPTFTPKVLELLRVHDAKATFFVVGERAEAHPELVRAIDEAGHVVGSHSYSHAMAFHTQGVAHAKNEVTRGVDAIAAILGKRPRLFRPPHGVRTPFLRDALRQIGSLICVTWSARGLDARGRSASDIVSRLSTALVPGAIVALHDGGGFGGTNDREATVTALDRLLAIAKEKHLACVSLEALTPR